MGKTLVELHDLFTETLLLDKNFGTLLFSSGSVLREFMAASRFGMRAKRALFVIFAGLRRGSGWLKRYRGPLRSRSEET